MDPHRPEDTLEHFRNGYLRLKSALHDRTTRLPAYPMLFDELRTLLDARRHLGVVHIEPVNIDLVESLYGWQVFDRTMAQLAAVVQAMPGAELPAGTLLAVAASRPIVSSPSFPKTAAGTRADPRRSGGDRRGGEAPSRGGARRRRRSPSWRPACRPRRARVSVGRPVLPVRAAGARRRPGGQRAPGASASGPATAPGAPSSGRSSARRRSAPSGSRWSSWTRAAYYGFEAFARGPKDSMFEMPRAMFALSGPRRRLGGPRPALPAAPRSARGQGSLRAGSSSSTSFRPRSRERRVELGPACPSFSPRPARRPADVVVEVSERAISPTLPSFPTAWDALRGQGFALALDDVGTGRDGGEARRAPAAGLPQGGRVGGARHRRATSSSRRSSRRSRGPRERSAPSVAAVGVESAEEAATVEAARRALTRRGTTSPGPRRGSGGRRDLVVADVSRLAGVLSDLPVTLVLAVSIVLLTASLTIGIVGALSAAGGGTRRRSSAARRDAVGTRCARGSTSTSAPRSRRSRSRRTGSARTSPSSGPGPKPRTRRSTRSRRRRAATRVIATDADGDVRAFSPGAGAAVRLGRRRRRRPERLAPVRRRLVEGPAAEARAPEPARARRRVPAPS